MSVLHRRNRKFKGQDLCFYSGLNLDQDKATKLQTVQIVWQGEATPYWFKVNPLYIEGGNMPNVHDRLIP